MPRRKRRGLGGEPDDSISVARDAAEERTPISQARSEELLRELKAERIGTSKTKVVVAQCIRVLDPKTPWNTISPKKSVLQQSVYKIIGQSKIREPVIVVSASRAISSNGETAILAATKGVDTKEEEFSSFPVTISPKKGDSYFDADHASFSDVFSHKFALKKIGVTHVIPCEGSPLFGIKKPRRRR